jgi:twitching motility protein PilT
VPAVEILIANPAVRKLIAEEREVELPTVIRSSYNEGMVDFTESLRRLIESEFIDVRTAFANAPRQEELRMSLKGIRASASGITG